MRIASTVLAAALLGGCVVEPNVVEQATSPAVPTQQSPTTAAGDEPTPPSTLPGTLPVTDETPRDGYERDLFGDYDRSALLEDNFADWPDCDGYYSQADDQCYADASDVDADHIVALGEAWDSGAHAWTDQQRDSFAGDPDNLWLMTDELNQSKSDQDIAEWLPPTQNSICVYLRLYVDVKTEWQLTVDEAEQRAIAELTESCA